ncbi:MAG: exosortase/archaeosortase family protein [Planctomycetes bacterium]|nr:exosortase/archaeosortase family protein [Planctomycetota bacterium]
MAENTTPPTTVGQKNDDQCISWQEIGVHSYVKMAIIATLFWFIFHVEIDSIVKRWVTDPSWSHGFLIPFFSLYFINQHKKEILTIETKPNYLGLVLLVAGVLFYPLNVVHFQYGYLKPIGMIATLGAIVLFWGGWKLIRYTWLPIGFLIFAVPLPQRYYVTITMPMRILAAKVSTLLLNMVNDLNATVSGVIIDVVYKGQKMEPPLNVAEACSGMRLLMAFLALGVAMAYLHYRPVWQRIVLLSVTVPIAVFCNIVRVTVTGFIFVLGDPKYAQGIYHDILGMFMLPLAFGLYGALAWFMASLFIEEGQPNEEKQNVIIRKRRT